MEARRKSNLPEVVNRLQHSYDRIPELWVSEFEAFVSMSNLCPTIPAQTLNRELSEKSSKAQ
jgi:hypothetical protein